MTFSVVLRVAEAALTSGRLAGEAEIVATGERAVVRDAGELIRFLSRSPEAGPGVRSEREQRAEQGGE
ncbi:MAG: hypothetical protein ACKVUT_08715 [Gaiella sp.]